MPLLCDETAEEEIAEVHLFLYDTGTWNIPVDALAFIDEDIADIFLQFTRYRINNINQVLDFDPEDTDTLFDTLNTRIPDYTAGDLIMIPYLKNFRFEETGDDRTGICMETIILIIQDLEENEFRTIPLTSAGIGDTTKSAVQMASDDLVIQLSYALQNERFIESRIRIAHIDGSEIILPIGKNHGVKRGDEFVIIHSVQDPIESSDSPDEMNSSLDDNLPESRSTEAGLLVVKDLTPQSSFCILIRQEDEILTGSEIQKVERTGLDTTIYADVYINLLNYYYATGIFGVKESLSLGMYAVRPVLGVEATFHPYIGFPITIYSGVDFHWDFGRIFVIPSLYIGLGIGTATGGTLSHWGGIAQVEVGASINNMIQLYGEVGGLYYFGISSNDYSGIKTGLGVIIKY